MTKVVVIIIAIIITLAGVYYMFGFKAINPSVPANYSSTSSAQPSNSSSNQKLENEVNSITLSTDQESDLDLIAIDEDIKGLE